MVKKSLKLLFYLIRLFMTIFDHVRVQGFVRMGPNGRFSGKNIELHGPLLVSHGFDIFCMNADHPEAVIKLNSGYIGRNFHCVSAGDMEIGKNMLIANNVFISNCGHGTDLNGIPFIEQKLKYYGPLRIGQNVWIGEGSHIIGSLEIGDNVIIGQKELVNCSIPCNSIYKNGSIFERR